MDTFGPTYLQRLADPLLKEQTPVQRMARRAMNYRGEGDYRRNLRGRGDYSGNRFSLFDFGSAFSGNTVQNRMDNMKLSGLGDYAGNAIIAGSGGPPAGITVNASDDLTGDIYLSHKEYVGQVTASCTVNGQTSTPFQTVTYPLNAGMEKTFPFLSQIANNYDLYEMQGLAFEYKPQYSDSGTTNNNLGRIMMVTQYDPDAPVFLNSRELQNYDYACSVKPSSGLIHGVETARIQSSVNIFYTRSADGSKSKVFTDLGNFTVATEGLPFPSTSVAGQTQILGELWVTYRVKLSRAKLGTTVGQGILYDMFGSRTVQIGQPFNTFTVANTNSGKFTVTPQANVALTSSTLRLAADPNLNSGFYKCDVYYETPGAADVALTLSLLNLTGVSVPFIATRTGTTQVLCPSRDNSQSFFNSTFYFQITSAAGIASTIDLFYNSAGGGSAASYIKLTITEEPVLTPLLLGNINTV